jgi:3-oxoacyl-[acyl-carrier-protein] synthase II
VTGVVISGCGVLSGAGTGLDALTVAVQAHRDGKPAEPTPFTAGGEPLPTPVGHPVPGFDIRRMLGRRGTSSFDRATGLAVSACGQALADAGLDPAADASAQARRGIGVALGTTIGSFRSTSDYSRETLVAERPYLVNPMLFPNTVMNCAAGQTAIRFGLKGANATVAGGRTAFAGALRYALNALRTGAASGVLVGAVEELTPHSAWLAHHDHAVSAPPGEGAAVFLVEPATAAAAAGRLPYAEVLATSAGFAPGGGAAGPADRAAALAGCVRRALDSAGLAVADVDLVVAGSADPDAGQGACERAERIGIVDFLGDCQAASGALQCATALALHRAEPARDGAVALLTGATPDGAVAAALLRGWSGAGAVTG